MVHFPLAILSGRYHGLYNTVHGPLSVGHTWRSIPWTSTSNTRSASTNKLSAYITVLLSNNNDNDNDSALQHNIIIITQR